MEACIVTQDQSAEASAAAHAGSRECEDAEPKRDPFSVYLGAVYGGTPDMLPSPGATLGFGWGDEEVQLHTEARFTGNPGHLWPFTPPSTTPTKASPRASADTFALASTLRVFAEPRSDVTPIFGGGLAIEQIAQAHYANTGVAGVLELGIEFFHARPVGFETVLRADIPGFSVRTNGGPSHAPVLTAGAAFRF